MKLYLVRHGETDWNIQNKIQGKTDTVLNETGRKQAQALAGLLKESYTIDAVYTSPQKRALETAQVIGREMGIDPIIKQGLEEMSLGKWEGYSWRQVRELFPAEYGIWHENRRYQLPPEGESYQQLLDRLLEALNGIIAENTGNVLIVTHSAAIMTLMSYIYDTPFEDMARNYKTGNTEIVELDPALLQERCRAGSE